MAAADRDASAHPLYVGNPCDSEADCAPGAHCVRVSSPESGEPATAGPPNGICSVGCDPSSEASCGGTAFPSTCVELGPLDPICLPACEVGDTNLETKCVGRIDLACVRPLGPNAQAYCTPRCQGDYQCPDGYCDLASGLCMPGASPRAGGAIGAACVADADCASGICERFGAQSFCSGLCSSGSVGCGVDPLSEAPLDAACLFTGGDASAFREAGFCGQLCDCDADCLHPAAHCVPLGETSPLRRAARGRAGYCSVAPDDGGGGLSCVFDGGPTSPESTAPGDEAADSG
jgi:hypothetical protein